MSKAMKSLPIVLSLFLLLPACADHGLGTPSLKPRAAEQNPIAALTEPPVSAEAKGPADPARQARIAEIRSSAFAANPAFRLEADAAWPVVRRAAGAARGSEPWVAAQMAISRTESARAPVKKALTALDDQLRLILFGPPSDDDQPVIIALRDVEGLDAAQSREINDMLGLIAR
jgi:hypothetical protein